MRRTSPAFWLLLALAFTAAAENADHGRLSGPVNGVRLDQYANRWWQWAYSMPSSESPVRDNVGVKCGVNQTGDVWFLAGGFGSSKITRYCEIPDGKHLFFPVINMLYIPSPETLKRGSITCQSAMVAAAANNDNLEYIEVVIDGETYTDPEALRVRPNECFDAAGGIPGKDGSPKVFPSATDGYWIMLAPLSPGDHEIRFGAKYNNPGSGYGTMIQDIHYKIRVSKGST